MGISFNTGLKSEQRFLISLSNPVARILICYLNWYANSGVLGDYRIDWPCNFSVLFACTKVFTAAQILKFKLKRFVWKNSVWIHYKLLDKIFTAFKGEEERRGE